jgi:predicted DNA-binding protein
MSETTTYIQLSEEEMNRRLQQAAKAGGKEAARDLREEIDRLQAQLQQLAVTRELVPEHVLLSWLDISRDTAKRWGIPVEATRGQTRFYDMQDVTDFLRRTGRVEKVPS